MKEVHPLDRKLPWHQYGVSTFFISIFLVVGWMGLMRYIWDESVQITNEMRDQGFLVDELYALWFVIRNGWIAFVYCYIAGWAHRGLLENGPPLTVRGSLFCIMFSSLWPITVWLPNKWTVKLQRMLRISGQSPIILPSRVSKDTTLPDDAPIIP